MSTLIVAATVAEVAPLLAPMSLTQTSPTLWQGHYRGFEVDLLITGVGMVATAAHLSRRLAQHSYDFALNLGVCGSFDPALLPGTVVVVGSDCMPELGAEDGEHFLSLQQLKLLGDDDYPHRRGRLFSASTVDNAALNRLPRVSGITVNTAHGADASIARIVQRASPQVESMEGAAFMYCCLIVDGPGFVQVRAVSNMVERRNRAAWKIPEAVTALCRTAIGVFDAWRDAAPEQHP